MLIAETVRTATWLALVIRHVEETAAFASSGMDLRREIEVELQQKFVESGIQERVVAQGRPPFAFVGERRGGSRGLE